MSETAERQLVTDATEAEAEIDAIIAECGGDPREAIRVLLHDLTRIALDSEPAISHGYVRGNLTWFRPRGAA